MRAFIVFGLVGCGAVLWEVCRDDVCSVLKKKNVELKEKTEQIVQPKVVEKVSPIQTQSIETSVQPEEQEEKDDKEEKTYVTLQDGFSKIVKKALPSVVNIATMQIIKIDGGNGLVGEMLKDSPFADMFKGLPGFRNGDAKPKKVHTLGSGFFTKIDKENGKAYIATNYHIVEKAKKIVIFLHDKTKVDAELHAYDKRTDIAVLSVKLDDLASCTEPIIPLKWGDSNKVQEGHFVLAIGNPFNLGGSVSFGIVSRRSSDTGFDPRNSAISVIGASIQHDAAINSGNSGGCLLNMKGEIIGMNNAILTCTGYNIGIGFAISSNVVKKVTHQLINHKRTFSGWIGVAITPVGLDQAISVGLVKKGTVDRGQIFGCFVSDVTEKGPSNGKLLQGDIILAVNGVQISESNTLQLLISNCKIGEDAKVKVWRCVKGVWGAIEVVVKIGDYEEALNKGLISGDDEQEDETKEETDNVKIPELGIVVAPMSERDKKNLKDNFKNGIKVVDVEDTNMLAMFGPLFMPGDIILRFNNEVIDSCSKLKDVLNKLRNDKNFNKDLPVPIHVWRGGGLFMIAVTLRFDDDNFEKSDKSLKNQSTKNKQKQRETVK